MGKRDQEEARRQLRGSREEQWLEWSVGLTATDIGKRTEEIARGLNELARSWYEEIAPAIIARDGE